MASVHASMACQLKDERRICASVRADAAKSADVMTGTYMVYVIRRIRTHRMAAEGPQRWHPPGVAWAHATNSLSEITEALERAHAHDIHFIEVGQPCSQKQHRQSTSASNCIDVLLPSTKVFKVMIEHACVTRCEPCWGSASHSFYTSEPLKSAAQSTAAEKAALYALQPSRPRAAP